jgi:Phage integrase family
VTGLRFHDLRHTAATLAAASGTSLKALMARIGHASAAAALRYQHVIDGQDAEIVGYLERFGEEGPSVPVGGHDDPPVSDRKGHIVGTPAGPAEAADNPQAGDQDLLGGDDGTRTHDPLLANQDGRNGVLARTFAAQRRA